MLNVFTTDIFFYVKNIFLIRNQIKFKFKSNVYTWKNLLWSEITYVCHCLNIYLNEIKHLFLLTSTPDHILGIFSVKLSHPMVAIPEHETLDSKEVNVRYN